MQMVEVIPGRYVWKVYHYGLCTVLSTFQKTPAYKRKAQAVADEYNAEYEGEKIKEYLCTGCGEPFRAVKKRKNCSRACEQNKEYARRLARGGG